MMLFDVQCEKNHRFEGWFNSNAGFEKQVTSKLISCPFCTSTKISKAPMAPKVLSGGTSTSEEKQISLKPTDEEVALRNIVEQVKQALKKNSTDVGDKFAEEARKIHYGESEQKNIHGNTTPKETKELQEEGVEFITLPDLEQKGH